MKKQLQRYLSILCVATMLFGILPTGVFAEETAQPAAVTEVSEPAAVKPAAEKPAQESEPEKKSDPAAAPASETKPAADAESEKKSDPEPAPASETKPAADPEPESKSESAAEPAAEDKPAADNEPAAVEDEKPAAPAAEDEGKAAEPTEAKSEGTPIPVPTVPVDGSLKVGGSVGGASPVGDFAPVLMALNASVRLISSRGIRSIPMSEFILGYRKTSLEADEFIYAFDVPPIPDNARCASYKISKRLELDISSVSGTCYVETDSNNIVTVARFAFGGVAAVAGARAKLAEASIIGKKWNEANVEAAAKAMEGDFTPISDMRASAWYRKTVACNILRGFYLETLENHVPARLYRPTSTLQLEQ